MLEFGLGVAKGFCSAVTGVPKYVSLTAASTQGFNTVGDTALAPYLNKSSDCPNDIGENELIAELNKNIPALSSSLPPLATSTAALPKLANTLNPYGIGILI